MANGETHILAGCAAGFVVACMDQGQKSEITHHPAVAMSVGAFFGKLPDLLEPATNPHHRQFCHSVAVFTAVGCGFKKAYDWKPKDPFGIILRGLALTAAGGYLSHLLFDAVTPRSLPLIGKV